MITLIYAGRNRRNMIRRELPRTEFASLDRMGRIAQFSSRVLLFVGPRLLSALLSRKPFQVNQAALAALNCASACTAMAHKKPSISRASAVTTCPLCLPRAVSVR